MPTVDARDATGTIQERAMIEPQVPTNKSTGQAALEGAPADSHETVRMTYRRLRIAGLEAREAASLTARLSGLPMVPRGWQLEEVERLLFVRELVRTGRMGS
jgi:hypothetical protein